MGFLLESPVQLADSQAPTCPPQGVHSIQQAILPTLHSNPAVEPKAEDLTPSDETTSESKTSRMIRRAIPHELHQPLGPDEPPPTYKLEAFVRASSTRPRRTT
jgi:hypothetical protein